MDIWSDFLTNEGEVIHKWMHYFPIYERYFAPWRNKSLTFLEIGVARGGSLQMWRRAFGPLAAIVGIDLDPKCQRHQSPGISVRIGDQSDEDFLDSVIDEFGPPDIVLDDGSHQMAHIRATFDHLYPLMPKNGIYMIEDLHTSYWEKFGGGLDAPASFINHAKSLIDQLNADHTGGAVTPDDFTLDTFSIAFFDSVVVFEKGQIRQKEAREIGGRRRGGF